MKRFNKNIIVFAICILFIIGGYNVKTVRKVISETKGLLASGKSVSDYTDRVDMILSERMNYHDFLMDINSVKENIQGTRIINKEDTCIVKSDSGKLVSPCLHMPSKSAVQDEIGSEVAAYYRIAEKNNAGFLSVVVPPKAMYESMPKNVTDYSREKYQLQLQVLEEMNIPTLRLNESLEQNSVEIEKLFFSTDHHWTPNIGFLTSNYICEDLQSRYGFSYNETYTDIKNYDVQKYRNWFLGSYGKKVGTFFSWNGADDFDLIVPKFETSFSEEKPFKDEIRKGEFRDTLLFMENLKKDYYKVNTYATYSGGDFRLQIMRNQLNPQGSKIVLIRDSYACVVAPFLALQASELHIIDVREGEDYVGDIVDVEGYVRRIKADYVVVIY